MKMFQPSVRALLLGSVFFTGTRGVALADHRDELTSKLRTASEKFSELQESRTAYFARSEITGHHGRTRSGDLIRIFASLSRYRRTAAPRNGAPDGTTFRKVSVKTCSCSGNSYRDDRTLEDSSSA